MLIWYHGVYAIELFVRTTDLYVMPCCKWLIFIFMALLLNVYTTHGSFSSVELSCVIRI